MQNQDFPGLGGESNQQSNVSDAWGQEIPKNEAPKKKEKKKLKLGGGATFNTEAPAFEFNAGATDFNFGANNDAMDFFGGGNTQQPQQNQFGIGSNGMDFMQQNQDPFYTYADPSLGYAENIIVDQFGNFFELEPNQYLDNGVIYEEEEQNDDYWNTYGGNNNQHNNYNNNYNNNQQKQQQVQKKDTKKKATKKEAKKPAQPAQPKRIRRLEKLKDQTEEQKAQQSLGTIKKQERFTIQQLKEKEAKVLANQGEKYIKLDYEKQQMNIVFIGHVDAGKSTLSGRILIDTNEIDEKTIKSFEQEAQKRNREGWFIAYCMDINEDEKAKGKTVETGKAFFELSNRRFTLLDAPGHKNYVPNMIMGACQSDMACLIISSKPGEFEAGFEKGGQTQEHVQLIRALGVSNMVCIVSKMDICNWSEERYNEIKNTMSPWLKKNCGFENISFIPIDAFGGQNISGRVDPALCKWYDGPTLFEYLNTSHVPPRNPETAVKIPVLDIQKEDGKFYCYGKIEAGNICEDVWVTSMPNRKTFQIQEIYDAKDRRVYYASAGENIKFKVKGIDSEEDLQRGFIVCAPDELSGVAQEFLAEINILEMPEGKQIMSSGYQCVLHMHTNVQDITVEEIQASYDKNVGKMVKNTFLKSGDKGIVKLTADKNVCLEKFAEVPNLGRFTLRDENTTIAYGTVKKFKPVFDFQRQTKK